MLKKLAFVFAVSLVSVMPTLAATAGSTAPSSLTADQVIRRNVAARGGEAAWSKVSTMKMTGQMDVGKGTQVPYLMDVKRGRKIRVEITFAGQTAVQVYDGANGWKRRPFLGHNDVEPFTAEEKQKASLDSDIDGLLVGYAAKGTKATLEGIEKVEERNAYKLKLTLKTGEERRVWIDCENFLEAKIDGTRRMDGRIKSVSTYYRDYHEIKGIKVPFLYETAIDGVKTTSSIQVETVDVNPALDDALFAQLR